MTRLVDKLFGIDFRSLAAFRIGTSVLLLVDLLFRSQEITAYFTDNGVLPRTARIELFEANDTFRFVDVWSLHMMTGQYWGQLLLIVVAAVFAFRLLVGYHTRVAAAVSWVLLVSLDSRNPMLLNSGDTLLRCMLLWSLFLPLGRKFSVDAATGAKPAGNRIVSVASAALLLQLAMMYFFSALFKNHAVWLTEHSAVYYVLNCDSYLSAAGLRLRELPDVVHRVLTLATLAMEFAGPLVVFCPWWTSRIRLIVVGVFWLFHLGLGVTMTIGLFPAICMVCWIIYLPTEFWDALVSRTGHARLARWQAQFTKAVGYLTTAAVDARPDAAVANPLPADAATFDEFATPVAFAETRPCPRWVWLGWVWLGKLRQAAVNVLIASLLLYVLIWNVRELNFTDWEEYLLPRQFNGPARALGLDQNWAMFSPIPRTEDGWLVMRGVLRDGTEVNLWEYGTPLPWDKPLLVSATYRTQRWRKYLDNLTTETHALHREYFANWLRWRWNERFAQEDKQREVVEVEVTQRLELTPPPGQAIPEPEDRILWKWYYQ